MCSGVTFLGVLEGGGDLYICRCGSAWRVVLSASIVISFMIFMLEIFNLSDGSSIDGYLAS